MITEMEKEIYMKCKKCGAVAFKCPVEGCSCSPCEHIGQGGCIMHPIDCSGEIEYLKKPIKTGVFWEKNDN